MSSDDEPVVFRRAATASRASPATIPSVAAADSATDDDDDVCDLGTLRAQFAEQLSPAVRLAATAAAAAATQRSPAVKTVPAVLEWDENEGFGALRTQMASVVLSRADEEDDAVAEGAIDSAPESSATEWTVTPTSAGLAGNFNLSRDLFDRLFPYQREGVAWMWSLHAKAPVAAGSLGRASERRTAGSAARGGASFRERSVAASLAAVALSDKIPAGILADDMGLGKTLQTVSFLAGLLSSRIGRTALVVVPVSLLETWRAEFAKFSRGVRVHVLHEQGGIPARARVVSRVQRDGGVLLTTYGLVTSTPALFGADEEDADAAALSVSALVGPCSWDALVLDEGHRVKNPATATSRAVRALTASFRLLLSGTPIQNNLEELWALFDFVAGGRLLDTRKMFNARIGNRIAASRDKRATAAQRSEGAAATAELMAIISPYMLRREKTSLFSLGVGGGQAAAAAATALVVKPTLTSLEALAPSARPDTGLRPVAAMNGGDMGLKKEIVLWVPFMPAQLALYKAYLSSCTEHEGADDEAIEAVTPGFRNSNLTGDFVFTAITNLRMFATHPLLVTRAKLAQTLCAATHGSSASAVSREAAACLYARTAEVPEATSGPEYDSNGEELTDDARAARVRAYVEPPWSITDLPSAEELVAMSGKLCALVLLLRQAAKDGAKTLVFSQHTRTLDIIEKVVSQLYTITNVEGLNGPGDEPAPIFARGLHGRGAPKHCRIDGSLRAAERTAVVKAFNADPAVSICLLTTGVGGLGLTLTSATRVILSDVSWNPATDAQAVDRAYRVGQGRDVVTYRLITAGGVEEKMYRLQVFKGGLTSSVMGARDSSAAPSSALRFLSSDEIKNLFMVGETTFSETQRLVDAVVSPPPIGSREIVEHLSSLASPPHSSASVGLSHHDHLFNLCDILGTPRTMKKNVIQTNKCPFRASGNPMRQRASETRSRSNEISSARAEYTRRGKRESNPLTARPLVHRPG
jgi:SNF2 family DNA or RNA helicase